MASDIEIANRALIKLGADTIIDFLDPTKSARTTNGMYAIVRDSELRAHRWNFAMKRVELPALVDTPAYGFKFLYQLPDDCLRIDMVNDSYLGHVSLGTDYRDAEVLPYAIEGRRILADFPAPLKFRYISRVTDSTQFDALFVESLACRLAMEMAETLTQSPGKRKLAHDEYRAAIKMALGADAIESPPEDIPDSSWMLSRVGP
jgi:hypothetical protein